MVDTFVKSGMDVTVYPTQRRLDAFEMTKSRAQEFDLIVCSGGDGTLDEVVTGILEGKYNCPDGYIPAGSTNDFALAADSHQSRRGSKIVVQDHPFACDIGSFNETILCM